MSTYSTLPPSLTDKIAAHAFRSLLTHLSLNSSTVSNMSMMTTSGFCRNCLGKWVTIAARAVADDNCDDDVDSDSVDVLNKMGYEDYLSDVIYGEDYKEWKSKYNGNPDETQVKMYNDSKGIWALHDVDDMKVKVKVNGNAGIVQADVCCQDLPSPPPSKSDQLQSSAPSQALYKLPSIPSIPSDIKINVKILTVSTRASKGDYGSGDLSGPAVASGIVSALDERYRDGGGVGGGDEGKGRFVINDVENAIVTDDYDDIRNKLESWTTPTPSSSTAAPSTIIFTTGGTGFSPTDVTPESTQSLLAYSCPQILNYVHASISASSNNALGYLSRGVAGVRGGVMVINLPGNPGGAERVGKGVLPFVLEFVRVARLELE